MDSVRVLGGFGLAAAALQAAGGAFDKPMLIGFAGLLMVTANTYALLAGLGKR